MRRVAVVLALLAGWLSLLAGGGAALTGMLLNVADTKHITTEVAHVPHAGSLLLYSLTVSIVATGLSLMLGLGPAALLGGSTRSRPRQVLLTGLCVAPLLIPPQVYAYAWSLATAPHRLLAAALPPVSGVGAWGSAMRAGIVSAGWLWPIVALIVAAGWRITGRNVYTLALLDTSPRRAFLLAVLPGLRAYLMASACLVFVITLVEYPIPHLCLARTYATELLLLVDVGAPAGQVVRAGLPAVTMVVGLLLAAWLSMWPVQRWGADDEETLSVIPRRTRQGWAIGISTVVWAVSVIVPVGIMITSLRVSSAWRQAFTLFEREWMTSIGVSLAAGAASVLAAVATVVWAAGQKGARARVIQAGAFLTAIGTIVPGAALGVGFVTIYNRPGFIANLYLYSSSVPAVAARYFFEDLYTDTPAVWVFALAARYGGIPVLIVWLALRKKSIATVEQARVDGAGAMTILAEVLLPMIWPALVAGGAVVALLALCEVVVSQLVAPVGYPSIALAILGLMHYGRDDTVIIASLLIVAAGVLVAQVGSWLLLRRE